MTPFAPRVLRRFEVILFFLTLFWFIDKSVLPWISESLHDWHVSYYETKVAPGKVETPCFAYYSAVSR